MCFSELNDTFYGTVGFMPDLLACTFHFPQQLMPRQLMNAPSSRPIDYLFAVIGNKVSKTMKNKASK